MNKKNTYIFLTIIVLLATVLRFVGLSNNPPALNWDEVSHGYNAYSILKTGRDEWGKAFPILNFRAYGDYPLPFNLYLTIPFIYTMGLNEFSVRIPHAILGVITVIAIYYLVLGLTKKKNTALLASFLAAIGPWYLFTSRFVVQSNLSVFSLITAAAFFVNREKKRYFVIISILFLWLTFFSYHTTRIFSPLLLVSVLFLYRKDIINSLKKGKLKRIHSISFILVFLFFGFSIFILSRPETRARSPEVFLIDSGMVSKIIEARNSSTLPLSATWQNQLFYKWKVI